MSRRGSAVVLLKHIAGIVHDGNLKAFFNTKPRAKDDNVYAKAQTENESVSQFSVPLKIVTEFEGG